MILYNVTVSVDNTVADEWLQWMKEVHIPEVMGTGYFLANQICRVMEDDNKTIVMVKKLNDELVTGMEAIKPEIESWIKGMTEADKEAFEKRVENKPYLKTIFQIMFDPEIGKRIEQNPELKAALDEGGKRMKALEVENGESEEGY